MQINHRRSRKQFFHQLPPAEHPPVDPPPDPSTRVATTAHLDPAPHPGGLLRSRPPEVASDAWHYTRSSRTATQPYEEPHPGALLRTRPPDVSGLGWHYTRGPRTAASPSPEPHPGGVKRTSPPEIAGLEWNIPPRYRRADLMPLFLYFQQPVRVLREFRKLEPRVPAQRVYSNANFLLPPLAYPAFSPRRTLMPDPVFFLRRIASTLDTVLAVLWIRREIPYPPFVPRVIPQRFVRAEVPQPSGAAWRVFIRDRGDILRRRRERRDFSFLHAELPIRFPRIAISHELLVPVSSRKSCLPDTIYRPAVARPRRKPIDAHYRVLARAVLAHGLPMPSVFAGRFQLASGAGPVVHARRVHAHPVPPVEIPSWRELLLIWNTGDIVHRSRHARSPVALVATRIQRGAQYRTGLSSAPIAMRREATAHVDPHPVAEMPRPAFTRLLRNNLLKAPPVFAVSMLADILVRPKLLADIVVSVESSRAPRRLEY